jgi:hypothetical protein
MSFSALHPKRYETQVLDAYVYQSLLQSENVFVVRSDRKRLENFSINFEIPNNALESVKLQGPFHNQFLEKRISAEQFGIVISWVLATVVESYILLRGCVFQGILVWRRTPDPQVGRILQIIHELTLAVARYPCQLDLPLFLRVQGIPRGETQGLSLRWDAEYRTSKLFQPEE